MSPIGLSRLLSQGRADHAPLSIGATFGQFRAQVAGVARAFAGCRSAALVCVDSHAFAVGLFGLLHAGAEVILPPNGLPATLDGLSGSFERLVDDVVLAALPACDEALSPLAAEQGSIAFFTSGSTGHPKRIARSLAALEREVAVLDGLWGAELGTGPVLATVSHQHLYGLTFKLLWPLAAGRPFDPASHEVWESLLTALPPGGVIISSPAHLSRLGGLVSLPEVARPSAIFTAGAPLSFAAAADSLAVLGRLPVEIFGSTETGAVAARRQRSAAEDWILLPGHQLLTEEEGPLRLISPYVEGVVETADQVARRPGGFHFLGRSDRVVKIEGKRIGLAEVERDLAALPWVEAAAVVLAEDARLAAAVVLTAAGQDELQRLGAFRFGRALRRALAAHQDAAGLPRLWRFVETLPSKGMGKRDHGALAALFAHPQEIG